jgi:hypothetical protein
VGARIFISHSCKDRNPNPTPELLFARKVRERIVGELSEQGHTVWLDVDSLVPGDRWRACLHEWLARCDGAVILLDKTSVTSGWLRKEATILGWRRSLQENLRVVPVFLGDFRAADLEKYDYGPLDIEANQAAQLTSTDLSDANAHELAAQVVASFAGLTHAGSNSPMGQWIRGVAALIDTVRAPVYVDRAAQSLHMEDSDWPPLADRSTVLASHLLHLGLTKGLPALNILAQGMSKENFAELAALCLPTWVDSEAAAELQARMSEVPRTVVAVNSDDTKIGCEYVGRATCWPLPSRHFLTVSDPVGEGLVDELLPRFEEALCKRLGIRPNRLDKLRNKLKDNQLVKYVLLTGGAADPRVAAALQRRYPEARIMLLPGPDWPEEIEAHARIVRPELDEARLDELEDARWELDQMLSG